MMSKIEIGRTFNQKPMRKKTVQEINTITIALLGVELNDYSLIGN